MHRPHAPEISLQEVKDWLGSGRHVTVDLLLGTGIFKLQDELIRQRSVAANQSDAGASLGKSESNAGSNPLWRCNVDQSLKLWHAVSGSKPTRPAYNNSRLGSEIKRSLSRGDKEVQSFLPAIDSVSLRKGSLTFARAVKPAMAAEDLSTQVFKRSRAKQKMLVADGVCQQSSP